MAQLDVTLVDQTDAILAKAKKSIENSLKQVAKKRAVDDPQVIPANSPRDAIAVSGCRRKPRSCKRP